MRLLPVLFAAAVALQACTSENDDPSGRTQESGTIETFAGMGPTQAGYTGDGGQATDAKLGWVTGIAVDFEGNVYITDGAANLIRKIGTDGVITTIAGTFLGFNVADPDAYSGDGGPAADAHLNIPLALAVDKSDNLTIADAGNNVVRYIDGTTGMISTLAGKNYEQGFEGDGGPSTEALIWNPYSVAADIDGNIYLADSQNNTIRKISAETGIITTIAGLGPNDAGYSGDGGLATAAKLHGPQGVAVDGSGIIYISDAGNNVIRKIDAAGVITTIAGTGSVGYTGDGGPATAATFSGPKGLAVGLDGRLYIADAGNSVIRMYVPATGDISTVAGNGTAGYAGDGGEATAAKLSNPLGVAVDLDGNLYIADTDNSAIRKVAQ